MAKVKSNGVGRPSYSVKWPYNKFTFNQLLEHNGVNLKTGKGKNCSRLTLFKALQRNTKGPKSVIVKLDVTREPNSKKGLGRKAAVFLRREKFTALKTASTSTVSVKVSGPRKTRKSTAPTSTEDYEKLKASIAAPVAPVAPTAPEVPVNTAPVVEPVIPTPAPVENTAPVEPVAPIAEIPTVTETPTAQPEMAAA